jgi:hypothetical protein
MDYPFKNYWFWVVVVLAVGISFFYITFNLPASNPGDLARMTIKFDKDNARAFEGPVDKDMTVLQALLSASRGGSFDFRYSLNKNGYVNLASINGATNGPKSWRFYLNGNPVKTEEIGKIKIKNGDLIEARYE